MRIYVKYLLKQLLPVFLVVSFLLTAVVWIIYTTRIMELIVSRGINIKDFLKLSLYMIPYLNFTTLPLSCLVAVIMVLNRLFLDRELVALKGAGFSYLRIAKPFILFACMVTCIAYLSSCYIMPKSYQQFKRLQFFLRHNYISMLLEEGTFATQIPKVTIYIGKKHDKAHFSNILISDSSRDGKVVTITAQSGQLKVDANRLIQLRVYNGTHQEYNINSGKLTMMSFKSYVAEINPIFGSAEQLLEPSEQFISELLDIPSDNSASNILKAHAHQRLTWPLYSLVFSLISVAAIIIGYCDRGAYWCRPSMAVVLAVVLITSTILLHNLALKHPSTFFLPYLNAFIPLLMAFCYLCKGSFVSCKK